MVLAAPDDEIEPGAEAETVVLVQNTGTEADEFTIAAQGPAASWATVSPATLELAPGQELPAWITFRPPRALGTSAGPVAFSVAVRSRADPTFLALEHGQVTVGRFAHLGATLVEPAVAGRAWTRFELTIENQGNHPVQAKIQASDPDEDLLFDISPAEIEVVPGAPSAVSVRVKTPAKLMARRRRRDRQFSLIVRAGGVEVVRVPGAIPDQSSLSADLARSAISFAVVMFFVMIAGAALLREGEGDAPGSRGQTEADGVELEQSGADADAGEGAEDAGGDGASTTDPGNAAAASRDPAGAPADLPALVFLRAYSPGQRDVVVRSGGAKSSELRLRSDDADEDAPVLSPDRGRVAYLREQAGTWRVCVISATGGEATCLAVADSNASVGWRDDNRLLFTRGVALFQIPAATDGPEPEPDRLALDVAGGRFSVSRDGSRLVFVEGRRIVVRPLDGSDGVALTVPGPGVPSEPVLSPSGDHVAYISNYQVFVAPVAPGPVRRLTADGTVNGEPAWSPAGDWVLFRSNRSGDGDVFAVRSSSADGSEIDLAQVTSNPVRDSSPAF